MPCCKEAQAALWTSSCGEELRLPASSPSWTPADNQHQLVSQTCELTILEMNPQAPHKQLLLMPSENRQVILLNPTQLQIHEQKFCFKPVNFHILNLFIYYTYFYTIFVLSHIYTYLYYFNYYSFKTLSNRTFWENRNVLCPFHPIW